MLAKLTVAAVAVAALLAAPNAHAFTLGVGDGAQFPAQPSADLGARTYRVVIDPDLPLESYTPRILAHRAVGQEPQLVIGGTGTRNHASSRGVVRAAVEAASRWPSAYSISVVNEPNESGMGVCEYARTFVQAYRSLKAVGVRRVLFGEWSPNKALEWHSATLTRCSKSSRLLRNKVGRVAWHGYFKSVDFGPAFQAITRVRTGHTPKLYLTEAGAILQIAGFHAAGIEADQIGTRYWRHALRAVKRDRIEQVVVWDLHSPQSGAWDSGLIDGQGRRRPAFNLIAGRS